MGPAIAIRKLMDGQHLSAEEAAATFKRLLDQDDSHSDVLLGSYLTAMQIKGPTVEEVAGMMDVILGHDRARVSAPLTGTCGIVGSGRDGFKTFNISTIAAIVAAAAGEKVIKNGCRSETSVAGTTDVLEALGLDVRCPADFMVKALEDINIAFFDAEPYFPRMVKRYVGKFPFINPISFALSLASPADFEKIVFGLADQNTEFTARVLQRLGIKRALIVCGEGPGGTLIDELSTVGNTIISEIDGSSLKTYTATPEDLGISRSDGTAIAQRKTVQENADLLRSILAGTGPSAAVDIVILNAAAVLYLQGRGKTIAEAVAVARRAIESGDALRTLESLIRYSRGDFDEH